MGHRALVAYECEDGYECHDARWGGDGWDLAAAITETTPFGGGSEGNGPSVDPVPTARHPSFEAVVAALDFLVYEAVYRVGADFAVRPYLVCWFGIPGDEPRPGDGALVSVRPADGDRTRATDGAALRGWYEGTKQVVVDVVARGLLSPADARSYLAGRVREWADEGRAVHEGPGVGAG